jgi:hypothetical protein
MNNDVMNYANSLSTNELDRMIQELMRLREQKHETKLAQALEEAVCALEEVYEIDQNIDFHYFVDNDHFEDISIGAIIDTIKNYIG